MEIKKELLSSFNAFLKDLVNSAATAQQFSADDLLLDNFSDSSVEILKYGLSGRWEILINREEDLALF